MQLMLQTPMTQKQTKFALDVDNSLRTLVPSLRPAQIATWSERQRLFMERKRPWIITPFELDPYITKDGGYPFPAEVQRVLTRIHKTGAQFDRIAIAHEVDPKGFAAPLLAKVPCGGVDITPSATSKILGSLPAQKKTDELAAKIDKAVTGTLKTPAHAVGALGSTLLDPIVFGIKGIFGPPAQGEPVLFYPLAAWDW